MRRDFQALATLPTATAALWCLLPTQKIIPVLFCTQTHFLYFITFFTHIFAHICVLTTIFLNSNVAIVSFIVGGTPNCTSFILTITFNPLLNTKSTWNCPHMEQSHIPPPTRPHSFIIAQCRAPYECMYA